MKTVKQSSSRGRKAGGGRKGKRTFTREPEPP